MEPYLISAHVHVCLTGEHAVFLDLRRDKYQAIGARERRALESRVSGWPKQCSDAPACDDSQPLLDVLLDRGLLTSDRLAGKEFAPPMIELPSAVLCEEEVVQTRAVDWREMLRFSIACLRAAVALRFRTLEHVVNAVRERKRRALARGDASTLASDRGYLAAFNRLRPFAFTADLSCLYDSLALVEFFALHGSYPDWVVGVHTSPFAAHSWVQSHGYLFNGPIDHVARYTPILVV
jgi:hypothetical protein